MQVTTIYNNTSTDKVPFSDKYLRSQLLERKWLSGLKSLVVEGGRRDLHIGKQC